MASIKKNFIYSSILTVANYIFPMITFPYVSRVLGVTNIGVCSFVDSIINYFILFAMMGLTTIGIREIAGTGGDRERQGKVFSSLLTINAISTLLMLVLLLISIEIIPQFNTNRKLLYIGAAKLISNLFLVEWFFKGTENFKYITQRSIIVKTAYVALVLLLVKTPDDYYTYFILLTGMTVVNAAINFPFACKKVKFSFKELNMKMYIKPFFIMGIYAILTSMYTSFNVIYLGMTTNNTEVGYYSTSTKLFSILIAIYTAFTGVMLPRMSALYSKNSIDEFKRMIRKSVTGLVFFAVPVVILTSLLASDIVYALSGPGYEGAYLPAKIIMPLIFIIGYEQILVIQILMPSKQDKSILLNSIIGAIVGISLNLILVHRFGATGSAIVWVMSEITVLCAAQYAVSKTLSINFPIKELVKHIILYIPSIVLILLISSSNNNHLYKLLLGGIVVLINTVIVIKHTQPEMIGRVIEKLKKK